MTSKDEYFLDGDKEAKRLSDNHECIKYFMGGKLIRAPLDTSTCGHMRILDSGTSDGTWLLDVKSSLPASAILTGTDIATDRLPKSGTQGVQYQIQDIHTPWPEDFKNSFDLVHQRLTLAASGPRTESVVHALCDLVKSGGWIQLVEADNEYAEDDAEAHKQAIMLLQEIFEHFGTLKDKPMAKELAGYIRGAGFENVQEEVVEYDIGARMPDEKLRKQGVEGMCIALEGLIGFAKSLPGGLKCMTDEQLDTLIDRYRKDVYEKGGYYPLRVVWGQKPDSE